MSHPVFHKQVTALTAKKSFFSGKQAAEEVLLLGATARLRPESKERISRIFNGEVDWRYLINLAELHGIAPLIAYNLTTGGLSPQIPQPYLELFNQIYNNNLYRNVILSHELDRVLSAFNQNSIPVIVLKGTILAEQLYGSPGLRTVADMDILVQPEKRPLAGSLLLNLGYEKSVSGQTQAHPFHEEPYYKNAQFPFFIELHRDMDDPRLVAIPQEEIWHRAQRLNIRGGTTLVLSPEDTFLYLSNNLTKQDSQVLKCVCDINELLKKYGNALDWGYIMESARSWGIKPAVYYSLERAKDFFGASVPGSAVAALKPGALRLGLMNCLKSRDTFIPTIKWYKLRDETAFLFRSLTMEHIHQTLLVLSRYQSDDKRWPWLSTMVWALLVFPTGIGRNILSLTRKRDHG